MIIIKNIILYFIQIRHTNDFPLTGARLIGYNYNTLNKVNNVGPMIV